MRASLHSFITREKDRRDRLNCIWRPLRGKVGVLGDLTSATDAVRMIADPDMILTGATITSATAAVAVESGGNFYAVVDNDTDECVLGPHTLANNSPLGEFTWGTDQEVEVEWLIQLDATLTDRWTVCGLRLTDAIDDPAGDEDTDNDQVYFKLNENAAIDLGVSVGGTDLTVDDVWVGAASDYVHLAIKFDPAGIAHTHINGREYNLNFANFGGSVGAGNVVDLIPFYGGKEDTSGGAHPKFNLVGFAISRAIGA